MKISVITPTYNDAESINETYQSLKEQTFENWEWIVINDGSTDNTNEILKRICANEPDGKVIWKEQENSDQLNAIIHASKYITGEYVFILHSDDLLPSNTFFDDCICFLEKNKEYDGIFGDLLLIDENNKYIGKQTIKPYFISKHIPPLQLLWLGRNLFCDVAFHRVERFKNEVCDNYLVWNTPFWLNITNQRVQMLNYKKAEFPILKYRIHQGNYINNELGKLNVINGELRTALSLMNFYHIPLYNIQYLCFRLFNKFGLEYKPVFLNGPTKNKAKILEFIIKKRYDSPNENMFLSSLYSFLNSNTDRELVLEKFSENLRIYYGKDVREFNKKLLNNQLEDFYIRFMDEMKKGFKSISVKTPEDLKAIKDITKFFCIDNIECFLKP